MGTTHLAARGLRHIGDARETAGRKYLYAPLRRLDLVTAVLRLLVIFRSIEVMREWRWTRNHESLVRLNKQILLRSVARPANSTDCSRSEIGSKNCGFVLNVQPAAHGEATMLGFCIMELFDLKNAAKRLGARSSNRALRTPNSIMSPQSHG